MGLEKRFLSSNVHIEHNDVVAMLDELSKEILKIIFGFGIEDTASYSRDLTPPHRSSAGLHALFDNVPKSTFYRKLEKLEKEGYTKIGDFKRLSRGYEIINGKKIVIPQRYTKSREIELTEKGKEIVSELLLNEIPREINVIMHGKLKKKPFLDAVEYLLKQGVEMHTAFVHLLKEVEKERFPINLERIKQKIFSKKVRYILKTPPKTADFVGRKDYLDKINNALKKYTIISVVGLAGIGKSYMIAHLYHQLENCKKFWWDFSRDSTDLNVILNTIAGFLDNHYNNATLLNYLIETKERDWRIIEDIIKRALNQESIFFFDNYHVLDDKEEREIWKLFDILKCSLIICSREKISKLHFMKSREIVLDKGFSKNEIKQFLENRGQSLVESQIERIYTLTKGIPYLVDGFSKIYTSSQDFEDIVSHIEEGSFDFIHNQAVRNLSSWEKSILTWASAFRRNEGFSAYDYVYSGDEYTGVVLNILVYEKKYLLRTPDDKYIIHDILKEYFYKNLGKESQEYHRKIAEYYLLDENPESVIEALYHLLRAEEYEKSADVAAKYSDDIINRGFHYTFLEVLKNFDSTRISKRDWVLLLNSMGKIHEMLGNWDISLEKYECARTIAQEIHFEDGEAQSRVNIGNIYYKRGEWDTSMDNYKIALTFYEKTGNTVELASVLSDIGHLYYTESKWDKAIDYLEKSLDILKKNKNEKKKAFALNVLGIVYFRKGNAEKALEFYGKALKIYESIEFVGDIAQVSGNIGLVLGSLNRWGEALQHYNKALEIAKTLGNRDMIAKTLSEMGVLYFYMEEHDESIECYMKALEILEELGNCEEIAVNLDCLGISYSCKGEWDKAEEYYKKSLEIKEKLNDIYGMAVTYNNLGLMLGERGDIESGIDYLNESIILKKALKDDRGIADSLKSIADLYMGSNKEKSLEFAQKSLAAYKKVGSTFGMGKMYFVLGSVYTSLNENEKAVEVYKKSIELFEETQSIYDIAHSCYKLGLLYRELGDLSSKVYLERSRKYFIKLEDYDKVEEIGKIIQLRRT